MREISLSERLASKEQFKGGGKRGYIVADTLLLMIVSAAAQIRKHLLWTKNVSKRNQKHFFVSETSFVSATNPWSKVYFFLRLVMQFHNKLDTTRI